MSEIVCVPFSLKISYVIGIRPIIPPTWGWPDRFLREHEDLEARPDAVGGNSRPTTRQVWYLGSRKKNKGPGMFHVEIGWTWFRGLGYECNLLIRKY